MKAEDKAKELIDRFRFNCKHTEYVDDNRYKHNETIKDLNAKQCALICVDEMIERLEKIIKIDFADEYNFLKQEVLNLEEVKQEINKQ